MLRSVHRLGSRIRHSRLLGNQKWLWEKVEPSWQRAFEWLSSRRGFVTRVNGEDFRLEYAVGARYDRADRREYEPIFYHAFVQRIGAGMRVFDLGAHVGLFTLGAAKRVGKEGRVYAFEPSPDTAEILERHIALNRWGDRVEVIRAVVSDVDEIVPFYVHGVSMAASLGRDNVEVLNPERPREPAVKINAQSVTLDRFCKERNIKPDIVKIDVEGAELHCLRGARSLLLSHGLTVFCEVHPRNMEVCGSSLSALEAYLDSVGYRLTALDEPNAMGIFHGLISRREGGPGASGVGAGPLLAD
jgi:FkbM family methyltransferase